MGNDPSTTTSAGLIFTWSRTGIRDDAGLGSEPRRSMAPTRRTSSANASQCPPVNGGSVRARTATSSATRSTAASGPRTRGPPVSRASSISTPQYGGVGKDCSQAEYTGACDCGTTSINNGTQLCDSVTPTLQVFAKAFPPVARDDHRQGDVDLDGRQPGHRLEHLPDPRDRFRAAAPTRCTGTARRSTRSSIGCAQHRPVGTLSTRPRGGGTLNVWHSAAAYRKSTRRRTGITLAHGSARWCHSRGLDAPSRAYVC